MNLGTRIAALGGGVVATALAGVAITTALASLGALTDSYDAPQISTVHIACPDDVNLPCLVDVTRVRPLKAAAVTEAQAAGLEATPARARITQVTVTQTQLRNLIAAGTLVP